MMFKNKQYAEVEKRYTLTVFRAGEEVCTYYYKKQQDRDDALVSCSNTNWNPEETYDCGESYIKVWR